jgi:hypothetical protein
MDKWEHGCCHYQTGRVCINNTQTRICMYGGLGKSTKSSKATSWTIPLQIWVTAYVWKPESAPIIVKIGKMPTKCDLNQKRKLKYKIGIGLDRKRNSALKQRKIRYDLHFYAFLKGEIPHILVFEYNIFRHTSYFNFDGTAK